MRCGLLLGLAIASLAYECNKMVVVIFDGAPPSLIERVKNVMKTKPGPQAKFKPIVVYEDPQNPRPQIYLYVVGVPIRDSMWEFVKPPGPVNVPVQEPFAKSRECEKKGFKVKTCTCRSACCLGS